MKEPEEKRDKFQPRIYIDKEGNWYQDGIPILHRWTYLYNNKLLKRDEEGRYYLDEGSGRVYAYVEDTPFVVKMIDKRQDGFFIILNDETEEKLPEEEPKHDHRGDDSREPLPRRHRHGARPDRCERAAQAPGR